MAFVSLRLRHKLIELYREYVDPSDRMRRNALMSTFIIADYSGKFPDQFNDPFIKKKVDHNGHVDPAYVERITHLAECLFYMSDEPTFGAAIRRLLERDVRPVFFELSATGFFKRRGFRVTINEETGVKGKDFDFIAQTPDGTLINVEASEFLSQTFSINALINKLLSKRKQVPTDKPAILFLHVHSSWYDLNDISFCLMKTTFDFFRRSKRYNAVIFQVEICGNAGEGFFWLIHLEPIMNPSPRHPIDTGFIFESNVDLLPRELKLVQESKETRQHFFEDMILKGGSKDDRPEFVKWIRDQLR